MAIPAPTPGSAAVITGASSGIGREIASQLASRGHDVILVARRRERLQALAEQLRGHGRRAEVIAADLAVPEAREELVRQIDALQLTPDVLALCAGFGMSGKFTEHDPQRLRLMLRTNVEGSIELTRAFAPRMQARSRGAILIVSSIVGNQPMPLIGVYAATKAALTSFGEMLHHELRPSGVTVTVLSPGVVHTEFSQVAEMAPTEALFPRSLTITPAACAAAGLDGLARGRRKVIPRAGVGALHFIGGSMPRGLWLRLAGRMIALDGGSYESDRGR